MITHLFYFLVFTVFSEFDGSILYNMAIMTHSYERTPYALIWLLQPNLGAGRYAQTVSVISKIVLG